MWANVGEGGSGHGVGRRDPMQAWQLRAAGHAQGMVSEGRTNTQFGGRSPRTATGWGGRGVQFPAQGGGVCGDPPRKC